MNEDRKAQFLSEQNRNVQTSMVPFRTFAPYEEERGEDVCMFPTEVLQKIFQERFGVSAQNSRSAISLLKTYNRWCKEKGYETSDGIYHVVPDTEEKILRRMVSSPKHLNIRLDEAYDPIEDETIQCLYRSLFWLVYMGMETRDALLVKTAEVDLESLNVTHNGRIYEIYREAIPAFRVAYDADFFNYHTRNMKYYKRVRSSGEYFLRNFRGDKPEYDSFRAQAVRSMKVQKDKLTFTNVYSSGIFYRAYEMERCGIKPDFSVIRIHDNSNVTTSWTWTKDYEAWKKAFA